MLVYVVSRHGVVFGVFIQKEKAKEYIHKHTRIADVSWYITETKINF